MISHLDPVLWYVLHTQLMYGVNTWDLTIFPGDDYGFVETSHHKGMIVGII